MREHLACSLGVACRSFSARRMPATVLIESLIFCCAGALTLTLTLTLTTGLLRAGRGVAF